MRIKPYFILALTLLAMSTGLFSGAEAKPIEAGHATVSWEGKGEYDYLLGDGDRVFMGTMTGTILVKHLPQGSSPAQIHLTILNCQTTLHIDGAGVRQTALCILRAHEDKDLAYAEIRCVGKKDECKGEFTWVWGRGGFTGITGTTPFVGALIIEKQKEGLIFGSAHWPNLSLSLP